MKNSVLIISLITVLLNGCGCLADSNRAAFTWKENTQGVELLENGKPVFFYQREPKSTKNGYLFNNYIHPLYSINGDTLTEEFPQDHPHHRGIFWAWHQIYIGNQSVGDGWMMENIVQNVVQIRTKSNKNQAVMKIHAFWGSRVYQNAKSFMEEKTTIVVHMLQSSVRKIDFRISLHALVSGVTLGGSDDEKGYGGFSLRLRLPDNLVFTSVNGPVIPQELQIRAGPWIDLSGSFGKDKETCGVTILSHPDTPNYPEPWILRQKASMQNVVFPGREKINITMGKPVVLRYRLLIHNGSAGDMDINQLQAKYANK